MLGKFSVFIAAISVVLSIASSQQTQCATTGIYFEEVEKSCMKYTRCIFGLRSEHTCNEGFQFDPSTSRCDLASIVGCNKCPENIEFGHFLAYPDTTNCSVGFVCFGDTYPFQLNCSENLHFDVDTLMCIDPEYSQCISTTTTEVPSTTTTITTTTEQTTTTTPPTTTTTATPTPPPTEAPGMGCEWSGCYHGSQAVCSTPNTGGSNRNTFITHKKCELIGRKDFCCDRNCKYQECGKTCKNLNMRQYSERGDVTCTIYIPNLGNVQSVQQFCCP